MTQALLNILLACAELVLKIHINVTNTNTKLTMLDFVQFIEMFQSLR